MGGGCYHMNAWQKLYQKWFAGCNAVKTTSSGKFNLYPLEAPCNGVQVLQLPFPGGKTRTFQSTSLTSYYLELRTATGFDSKYGSPSVLVHAGGAPILPNQTNPKGLHVWALAAGGTTWGLTAGKSFSDPAGGLTITVDSVDATHAVVDVAYTAGSGTPTCLDGNSTPFVPPGSDSCGAPPTIGDASPPTTTPDAKADTGTGGTGGAGIDAAGGTAGVAGSSGAGAAGKAGAAGSGGSGGTGGTGGSTGGTGGTGGSTGGDGGTGGSTGGSGGDTGGTAGDGGKGGRTPSNPEPISGCGCKVGVGNATGANSGALFMLGLVGWLGTRRRRQSR
jgi:hypothetical protein